jgi:hypothetical protein
MTIKWLPAALAAALGLAAVATYAEEVKLTDQDRVELRQRASDLQTGNKLGRSADGMQHRMIRSGDMKRTKAKHARKHVRKHARRTK